MLTAIYLVETKIKQLREIKNSSRGASWLKGFTISNLAIFEITIIVTLVPVLQLHKVTQDQIRGTT